MPSYKITAQQLKSFNEKAFEEKQNRILNIKDKYSTPQQCPQDLDMSKLCVINPLMPHKNHDGVESWRCHVCYAVKGQEEPIQALIDVPLCFKDEVIKDEIIKPKKNQTLEENKKLFL